MRRFVAAPHPQADLERLLQPLEAFPEGREGNSKSAALRLVPGCPDAQPCPAAREHVERGHRLGQDARMAVDDARDHGAQPGPRGLSGQERERAVAFQHLPLRRAVHADLEEMIHHPDRIEAGRVRGPADGRQRRTEPLRSARPGEIGDAEADLHRGCQSTARAAPAAEPKPSLPACRAQSRA